MRESITADAFADPFPHIQIDNFFSDDYLNKILNEFPDLSKLNNSQNYKNQNEIKFANNDFKNFPQEIKIFFDFLNSETFLNFLQNLTSIKEKLIADKSKSVEKNTTHTRIVNPAKDLLIMKKNYEVHTDRYNDKIDYLTKENKNLKKELSLLRKDNDNMPIPQSVQRDISNKISELEMKLAKAVEAKTYYMNLCYNSKDVDDSIIINNETKESPRRGLGEVLKAK